MVSRDDFDSSDNEDDVETFLSRIISQTQEARKYAHTEITALHQALDKLSDNISERWERIEERAKAEEISRIRKKKQKLRQLQERISLGRASASVNGTPAPGSGSGRGTPRVSMGPVVLPQRETPNLRGTANWTAVRTAKKEEVEVEVSTHRELERQLFGDEKGGAAPPDQSEASASPAGEVFEDAPEPMQVDVPEREVSVDEPMPPPEIPPSRITSGTRQESTDGEKEEQRRAPVAPMGAPAASAKKPEAEKKKQPKKPRQLAICSARGRGGSRASTAGRGRGGGESRRTSLRTTEKSSEAPSPEESSDESSTSPPAVQSPVPAPKPRVRPSNGDTPPPPKNPQAFSGKALAKCFDGNKAALGINLCGVQASRHLTDPPSHFFAIDMKHSAYAPDESMASGTLLDLNNFEYYRMEAEKNGIDWDQPFPLFIKIQEGKNDPKYVYRGDYTLGARTPLSPDDFRTLPQASRKHWCDTAANSEQKKWYPKIRTFQILGQLRQRDKPASVAPEDALTAFLDSHLPKFCLSSTELVPDNWNWTLYDRLRELDGLSKEKEKEKKTVPARTVAAGPSNTKRPRPSPASPAGKRQKVNGADEEGIESETMKDGGFRYSGKGKAKVVPGRRNNVLEISSEEEED